MSKTGLNTLKQEWAIMFSDNGVYERCSFVNPPTSERMTAILFILKQSQENPIAQDWFDAIIEF